MEMMKSLPPSKREDKKRTGTFYTPYALAMSISQRTIKYWINSHFNLDISDLNSLSKLGLKTKLKISTALKEIKILDPSVGEGAFLLAMADILYRIQGTLVNVESEGQIRGDIVSKNLYGVDIRHEPIKKCVQALKEWVNRNQEGTQKVPKSNIRQGNSLIGILQSSGKSINQDTQAHPNVFHWNEIFPEIFKKGRNGFDIVIGNPPYGNIIPDKEKQIIRKTYRDSVSGGRGGTWNIASIFIVRSQMLLRE
ncbi:MAG: Eco57I restriction-modification methylase domain-containing protein, partial [Candidatus Thorarchaeota archaeon]